MLTAGEIMTKDVVSVQKETSIRELAELFTVRKISSAPVVDAEGDLIGIVTETDLVEQDKSLHIPTVISLFDWVIYLESGIESAIAAHFCANFLFFSASYLS